MGLLIKYVDYKQSKSALVAKINGNILSPPQGRPGKDGIPGYEVCDATVNDAVWDFVSVSVTADNFVQMSVFTPMHASSRNLDALITCQEFVSVQWLTKAWSTFISVSLTLFLSRANKSPTPVISLVKFSIIRSLTHC